MNEYWFRKRQGLKSKDLGWGWVPITWEGWALVLLLVVLIFTAAFTILGESIATDTDPSLATLLIFLGSVIVLVGAAAFISRKKTRP